MSCAPDTAHQHHQIGTLDHPDRKVWSGRSSADASSDPDDGVAHVDFYQTRLERKCEDLSAPAICNGFINNHGLGVPGTTP